MIKKIILQILLSGNFPKGAYYIRKVFTVFCTSRADLEKQGEQKHHIAFHLSPSLFQNISFLEYHTDSDYFSLRYLEGSYTSKVQFRHGYLASECEQPLLSLSRSTSGTEYNKHPVIIFVWSCSYYIYVWEVIRMVSQFNVSSQHKKYISVSTRLRFNLWMQTVATI